MGGCWSCCRDCLDLPPPINPEKVDLTHFERHRVLGRGGFGKVQVIQSRLNNDYYALKSISKSWLVQSASNVQSVWLERHIMVQIRSPFLVPVYYSFQDDYNIYLVMHFLPGGDLHFLLQNKSALKRGLRSQRHMQSLPESHVKFYMIEILLGLEEMHSFGLVYRDLKPENILMDAQGHVRLSDFGLAGDLNLDEDGRTVGACGTSGYMSQELLANLRYDTTPDVFAFGVVMYELLHAAVPPQVDDPSELYFAAKVSDDAKALMRSLLQPDPSFRIGCDSSLPLGERWSAVKAHPFFYGVDWARAARRELEPPFIPEADTANCDPLYELEEQLSEQPAESLISAEENAVFNGWDWHTEPEWHTRRSNLNAGEAAALAAVETRAQGSAAAAAAIAAGDGARPGSEHRELMHVDGDDLRSAAHQRTLTSSSFDGVGIGELQSVRMRDEEVMSASAVGVSGAGDIHLHHIDLGIPVIPPTIRAHDTALGVDSSLPPHIIKQNPAIDAYTHHYASSPAEMLSSPSDGSMLSRSPAPSFSPQSSNGSGATPRGSPRNSISPLPPGESPNRHTQLRKQRAVSTQLPSHSDAATRPRNATTTAVSRSSPPLFSGRAGDGIRVKADAHLKQRLAGTHAPSSSLFDASFDDGQLAEIGLEMMEDDDDHINHLTHDAHEEQQPERASSVFASNQRSSFTSYETTASSAARAHNASAVITETAAAGSNQRGHIAQPSLTEDALISVAEAAKFRAATSATHVTNDGIRSNRERADSHTDPTSTSAHAVQGIAAAMAAGDILGTGSESSE